MAFDDQLRVSVFCVYLNHAVCSCFEPLSSTGAEVGIAWMSQVCNTGAIRSSATGEYTSGTGVSSISK